MMTIKELRHILSLPSLNDDDEIKILLSLPSVGPRATTQIKSINSGIDWDRGLLITPDANLVPKTDKQSIFEAAYDLLFWLATKPCKRESYEIREAKRILLKYGRTEEDFIRLRKFFHGE